MEAVATMRVQQARPLREGRRASTATANAAGAMLRWEATFVMQNRLALGFCPDKVFDGSLKGGFLAGDYLHDRLLVLLLIWQRRV